MNMLLQARKQAAVIMVMEIENASEEGNVGLWYKTGSN